LPREALLKIDRGGALEINENRARACTHCHLAANMPNEGQIADLPRGSILETRWMVDREGIDDCLAPYQESLRRFWK